MSDGKYVSSQMVFAHMMGTPVRAAHAHLPELGAALVQLDALAVVFDLAVHAVRAFGDGALHRFACLRQHRTNGRHQLNAVAVRLCALSVAIEWFAFNPVINMAKGW